MDVFRVTSRVISLLFEDALPSFRNPLISFCKLPTKISATLTNNANLKSHILSLILAYWFIFIFIIWWLFFGCLSTDQCLIPTLLFHPVSALFSAIVCASLLPVSLFVTIIDLVVFLHSLYEFVLLCKDFHIGYSAFIFPGFWLCFQAINLWESQPVLFHHWASSYKVLWCCWA